MSILTNCHGAKKAADSLILPLFSDETVLGRGGWNGFC